MLTMPRRIVGPEVSTEGCVLLGGPPEPRPPPDAIASISTVKGISALRPIVLTPIVFPKMFKSFMSCINNDG
jgi:hypothetical protein